MPNPGEVIYSIKSVSQPRGLTHFERFYNGSGETQTQTFSVDRQDQWTSTVSTSYGGGASSGMVIVKLESSVGRDLANAGSKTYGSSVSVTASLGSGKYLVGYRGSIEASGTWMKQTCTTSSGLVTSASGSVFTWQTPETGTQRCDLSAPSGSLAALAKSYAC